MNAIRDFVTQRGIQCLCHFTKLEDLNSILMHGLLPRDRLPHGCAVKFNDAYRLDQTDAVCTSISFPNYKLFYRFRKCDTSVPWVVIRLLVSVLWETRCVFCTDNAASNSVTAIPIVQRTDVAALSAMFDDWGGKSRANLGIPNNFPTNPQAEVLLLQGAPTRYIQSVYFMTQAHQAAYRSTYPRFPMEVNGGYFLPRCDYRHWCQ